MAWPDDGIGSHGYVQVAARRRTDGGTAPAEHIATPNGIAGTIRTSVGKKFLSPGHGRKRAGIRGLQFMLAEVERKARLAFAPNDGISTRRFDHGGYKTRPTDSAAASHA